MDFTPFFKRCDNMPENDRRWAKSFCQTVSEVFGDSEVRLQNIGDVCALFYGQGSGLSKAQFYRKRKFVVEFYTWLFEEHKVDQDFLSKVISLKMEDVITTDELEHFYFKNLDSALGFVNLVAVQKGFSQTEGVLNIKSLIILVWNGFDLMDIVELKKSDIDIGSDKILFDGKEVEIDHKYIKILSDFAKIDKHEGFPSGKVQDYLPSSYLFRSSRAAQLQPNNINCSLRRFNEVAKYYGHVLGLNALKKNGIFSRLSSSEDQVKISQQIQKMTGCDRFVAFDYAHFYVRWKEKFYDN